MHCASFFFLVLVCESVCVCVFFFLSCAFSPDWRNAAAQEDAHAGTAMESPMFASFCALDGDRSKARALDR